jgi:hypothetical protein
LEGCRLKKRKEKGRVGAQNGIAGLLAEDHNSCYHTSTVPVKEYFGASQRFLEMIEGKGGWQEGEG